jgi:hypothetical protein
MADINPQQELYLAYLFDGESETKGNSIASCVAAGYSKSYHPMLVKMLREEIINRTVNTVISQMPKAAMQLVKSLDEDGSTPRGELRLKAAESLLDRGGVGKQQSIDITSKDEQISPLFVLPPKDNEVEVDPKYDNINLNRD